MKVKIFLKCEKLMITSSNKNLFQAVQTHDLALANSLLESGAPVNERDGNDNTPLILACNSNHADMVKLLLEHGANWQVHNKDWESPLILASYHGNLSILKLLVELGAQCSEKLEYAPAHKVEVLNNQFMQIPSGFITPLIIAAQKGYAKFVEFLLKHGADYTVIDHFGSNAFHYAAWYGFKDCVQAFINHGADVNTRAFWGETPLYFVCSGSSEPIDPHTRLAIAKLLLHHGADPNLSSNGIPPIENFTLREYKPGDYELIRELLGHGVDPEDALFYCTEIGNLELVKMIIEKFGQQADVQGNYNNAQKYYEDTQDPKYSELMDYFKEYLSK